MKLSFLLLSLLVALNCFGAATNYYPVAGNPLGSSPRITVFPSGSGGSGGGGLPVGAGTNIIVITNAGSSIVNATVSQEFVTNTFIGLSKTNIASLLSLNLTNQNALINVEGYRTPNDNGGGLFYYDRFSTNATNFGTVFAHVSGTGRWLRMLQGDDIYVEMFGASSTLSNNAPYIQDALNWWIYSDSQRKGKIRIRTQSYMLESPLIIARTNSSPAFDRLFGLTIEADTPTGNRTLYSAEFVQLNTNYPAIIMQYCDSMIMKNFNVRGMNTYVGEGKVDTAAERQTNSNFLSSIYAIRTNHYSPHAGIVVDPFSSDVTLSNANQYPNLEQYYIGTVGGSGNLRFENVKSADFYVAFLLNPNPGPSIQQGDAVIFDNCLSSGSTYAVAVGQSQSRAVHLRDFHQVWSMIAITTKSFGKSTGAPPVITGGQFGNSKYWFDVDTTTGELSVTAAYSEALNSIGWIAGTMTGNNLPASFKDCKFGFAAFTDVRPDFYGLWAYAKFDGCQFTANGANTLNFVNGDDASGIGSTEFVNCRFQNTIQGNATLTFTTLRNVIFDNCWVYDQSVSGGVNAAQLKGNVKSVDWDDYNRNYLPFGAILSVGSTNYVVGYDNTPEIEAGFSGFVFNGDGTGEGFVSSTNSAALIKSNDVVVTRSVYGQYEPDGDGSNPTFTGRYVGRISLTSTNWFTLVDVPPFWTTQTVSSATVRRPRRFHEPTTGDLTNGSAVIANFSATNAWNVGDQIRGTGIPMGTYIVTNDGVTVVMSRAATATGTGIALYDARYFRVPEYGELTALFTSAPLPTSSVRFQIWGDLSDGNIYLVDGSSNRFLISNPTNNLAGYIRNSNGNGTNLTLRGTSTHALNVIGQTTASAQINHLGYIVSSNGQVVVINNSPDSGGVMLQDSITASNQIRMVATTTGMRWWIKLFADVDGTGTPTNFQAATLTKEDGDTAVFALQGTGENKLLSAGHLDLHAWDGKNVRIGNRTNTVNAIVISPDYDVSGIRGQTNSGPFSLTGISSNASPVNTLGQLADGSVVKIANGGSGSGGTNNVVQTNNVTVAAGISTFDFTNGLNTVVNGISSNGKVIISFDVPDMIVGPASSTDNGVVRWDGTTGLLVQDTPYVTISDTATIITTNNVIATNGFHAAGSGDGIVSLTTSGGVTNAEISAADGGTIRVTNNIAAFQTVITNWINGQRYTNTVAGGFDAQRATVYGLISCNGIAGGLGQVSLYVEHGTETTNVTTAATFGDITNKIPISLRLSPGDYFYFTNESTGSATATILSGSWIGE